MYKLTGVVFSIGLMFFSSPGIAGTVELPTDYQDQDQLTTTELNDRY